MKSTSPVIVALILSTSAYAAEKPSQAFLKKAIEGNYAEIQMGQLAQQNGESEGVKKFGQALSDDHSAANQKATDVESPWASPCRAAPTPSRRLIMTKCRD